MLLLGRMRLLPALVLLLFVGASHAYNRHTCVGDRSVIVHLFCWKWTDIERECRDFLGPKGFCGVQVSPANEHRVVNNRPWWERYQPVSYILGSRSGSPEEFARMVRVCNENNVRIYVDMVVNHMVGINGESGTGSWGSHYDTSSLSFPGVPFGDNDFNCCFCSECSSSDCGIQNYGDANQVRNCRLVGLGDLKLSTDYVRTKIADFFNNLIDIGVAGFRVDACKHMWPGDMEAMYSKVKNLNTEWFPSGAQPFVFNEVIDLGGEAIGSGEYTHLGRVTEFKYCNHIASAFRKEYPIKNLKTFGESWGMLPTDKALVFVDNHDNQRGHGAGGDKILTFYEPRLYKLAVIFEMAWHYGFTRIMSSYRWPGGRFGNDGEGPPHWGDYNQKDVEINSEGVCDDGSEHTYVCEHRWNMIGNMAEWRNQAGGEGYGVDNWWDNGNNQIAFSRNGKAFIAFNHEDGGTMSEKLQTGLPEGSYCDIISGNINGESCTGETVYVDGSGYAQISISASSEDPVVAIHAKSRIGSGGGGYTTSAPGPASSPGPTTPPPAGYQRTVIFIQFSSSPGQDLFIRGGISHDQRPGCNDNADTSPCAIPISHNELGTGPHYEKQNAWNEGNTRLNWYGAQSGQGSYNGQKAEGTPAAWTTNQQGSNGYQQLNKYGPNHWMIDFNMDCGQAEGGWFELKSYVTNYGSGWEGDIRQGSCTGSAGGSAPYKTNNHMARCGFVNVFNFGDSGCEINTF